MAPIRGFQETPIKNPAALIPAAIGILLIISAVLKGTDLMLFVRQIRAYGMISHSLLLLSLAWAVIWVEWVLGLGLLVRFYLRLFLPAALLLFLGFVGATGWAWSTGMAEDCGCFGAWVKRSPGEALFEDIIILAFLVFYWFFRVRRGRWRTDWIRGRVFFFIAWVGLFIPLLSGLSVPRTILTHGKHSGEGRDLSQIEELASIHLKTGTHLIVLIDTGCQHCLESFDAMNDLSEDERLPDLTALCMNDETEIAEFKVEFEPIFPLKKIQEHHFWTLLGEGGVPYTILLHNGSVLQTWNRTVPEKSKILALTGKQ
jgi:hypothetical protein